MNNFTIPKINDRRRPDLSVAQDETSRVSKRPVKEEGRPISREQILLRAANKGEVDIGELGEPMSRQQILNRARVKQAASEILPKLQEERYQEYLRNIKEDAPGFDRAISAANTAVKGLLESVPGAVETTAIMATGLYNVFQSEENDIQAENTDWYKAGVNIRKELEEAFPDSPLYRNEFWAGTIAKGAGQMLGNLLAVYATGGQSVWAAAGAAAGFNATLSSQYYKQAKAEGASEEEAISNTLVNMAGVSAMEALPMARLLRRVNKATGNGIGTILKAGFKGTAEEAVQEASQTMFENATGQAIYDSSRELMQGVWEAAAAGAILGGVANVSISTLGRKSDSQLLADRIGAEQGVISIAKYYGDIIPQFGDMSMNERITEIRRLLDIRKKEPEVTITKAGATQMGVYSPEITPISELKKKGKLKELWTKYIAEGGIEGKQMQVFRERRNARIDKELEEMQINMHALNKSILEAYGSNKKNVQKAADDESDPVPADIGLTVDQALRGEQTNLPQEVQARVKRMNMHIKNLSAAFIKKGYVEGETIATFVKNLGSYIHRDYKLFNPDVRWDKTTIPADVWNRAVAFMRSHIKQELRVQEDLVQRRQERLKSMIEQGASLESRQEALGGFQEPKTMTEEEINREAEKRIDRILSSRGAQSIHKMFNNTEFSLDAGSRDVLMQRQEIPEPIRDVMGEYKEGAVNYINTVNKMANHLHRRKFFDTIAEEFRGTFFFTRDELSKMGEDITQYTSQFNDGGLGSALGKDGNQALFMHRDLYEAMTIASNPSNDHGTLMTLYLRGLGAAKYSKTVLSHVAHIRNLVGGTGFLLNQGLFFQTPGTAKGSFRNAMTVFKGYQKLSDQELEARWKKYVNLGLTAGSVKAGELRDILSDMQGQEFDSAEQFMEEMFNHHKAAKKGSGAYNVTKGWFKKYSRKATNLYKAEDTFLRVWMYEMEKSRLQEADPNITDQEVADIVNDLYPNYDRVNNFIKSLRKAPIAPFISFPAEVVRTSINTARRARVEIRSDNKKLKKIGRKRIAGMFTNLTMWTAIGAASQALLGMTDEEEQSIREFLPPWARNSSIMYLGSNEGKVHYLNLSYTNPYEFLTDPIFSIIRGDSDRQIQDRFMDSLQQMFEPIYNPEIFTKAIGDLLYNSSDGREIWNPEEPLSDKLQKQFVHMWNSLEPGSISSAERIMEPILDETSSRNVSDELLGFTGFRVSTVDVQRSFGFRIRDFRQRIRDARRVYNSVKYKKGATRDEKREALERSNTRYQEIFREMSQMTDAAQTSGVSWYKLRDIMKDSGLASRDIDGLRSGRFQPFER